MHEISEFLKKYHLVPSSYQKKGKAIIVSTKDGKYVIKNKNRENNNIFKYLESRSFDYFPPKMSTEDDDFELMPYIEEPVMPQEQKMMDLIDLIALLHSKTTYYQEVDLDDFSKIEEDIHNNIEYLNSYYNDIITLIENKVIYSPSEYLLARNISIIFDTLNYVKNLLDKWYSMVKEKEKQRFVVIHNNLDLDHFLKENTEYLISWDKSKVDLPIYDLYKLYKKNHLDYDFEVLLKRYERTYPLLEEEKRLFHILILLPDKIEFNLTEYEMCKKISNMIDSLYKTKDFVLPYYAPNNESNEENNINKINKLNLVIIKKLIIS